MSTITEMNLAKHLEFIQPQAYDKVIHVIGVGAIGSRIVEQLVRLGFENLYLYDFDTVEDYNITNQLYTAQDIGKTKLDALAEHILAINPNCKFRTFPKGYTEQPLSGTVFLCVDSITLRREIVEANMYNNRIELMLDCRMRLTDAQSYAAIWNNEKSKKVFLNTMLFTEEEADMATPVSACGTSLSVSPTVTVISSLTVSNFVNFLRGDKEHTVKEKIFADAFLHTLIYY